MRTTAIATALDRISEPVGAFAIRMGAEIAGLAMASATAGFALALASWSADDPSFNHATSEPVRNLLGAPGAAASDLMMQLLGLASITLLVSPCLWGWRLMTARRLERAKSRLALWLAGGLCSAGLASLFPATARWPLPTGF